MAIGVVRLYQGIANRLSEGILAEALRRYGTSPDQARALAAADTIVYECSGPDGPLIMKITHTIRRPPDYIQAELDWLAFLKQEAVPVAGAVTSQAGQLLELIPDRDGHWLARAYALVPGRPVEDGDRGLNLYRAWGQVIGQLHSASRRYPEPFSVSRRLHWHEVLQLYLQGAPRADQSLLWTHAQRIVDRQRGLPATPETYGMVHGDVHLGNFHLDDGRLTVFDFDACHYNWFISDIAFAVYHVVRQRGAAPSFLDECIPALLGGYREHGDLDLASLQYVPEFLSLRRLIVYALLASGAPVAKLDNDRREQMRADVRAAIERDEPVAAFDFAGWAERWRG